MALRVTRGLFRLWLVLSVLWIGGVAVETWWTFPVKEWLSPPSELPVPPWEFDPEKWLASRLAEERHAAIRFASVLALAPPALIFAFGSALIWAIRGFR
jgi:hypothetical protein